MKKDSYKILTTAVLLICGGMSGTMSLAMEDSEVKLTVEQSKKKMRNITLTHLREAVSKYPFPASPTVFPNPKIPFNIPHNPGHQMHIHFYAKDTFGVAEYLIKQQGENPAHIAVLNMANDHSVAGGYLNGARAQEEILGRMSNLFLSLMQRGYGKFDIKRFADDVDHDKRSSYTYQNWVHDILHKGNGAMYSPAITVFKSFHQDQSGQVSFTDTTPFTVNVISSAAVDLGHKREGQKSFKELDPEGYEKAMKEKIENQIKVAIHYGNDVLVLGAFGCGAFSNDPTQVARWYKELLFGKYNGYFRQVIFAIIGDHNDTKGNMKMFSETFSK